MKPSRTWIGALVSSLALATPALSQQLPPMESIARIGDVIRWGGIVTSLFVILGAWMLLRLLGAFVGRFSSQFAARRLTMQKLNTIVQFLIFVVTTTIVITLSFRINQTLLALIGGSAAVAIGFALKDLVASFVAGITIILDQPFQVGDRVEFGGYYGDITSIGLRSVRLQTLDDNTVTIPNSKFLSDITSSGNYGALDMQVGMDFHVAIDQDIDLARSMVTEAALSSRYIFLDKPVVVHVHQVLAENLISVRLSLKAYVLDTRHEKAFETDVNLRCLRAFREAGIQAPSLVSSAWIRQE